LLDKADKSQKTKEENYESIFTTKIRSQKPDLIRKDRAIKLYMGQKITTKLPKFMIEDFFEKKCKEILKFDQSPIEKRTAKFWDTYPFLKLRRCYNKYAT